ncbi:AIPR protein [Serratia fonticola]|uniref:AIPR family protein n=1 Tax=Serratia fonticola TaxID=47917 RepID=UPI00217AA71C|nr:AIPR family protein [Serratia fonticola]CAI1935341.1 AIPR protein [Serratia fonticola]
MEYTIQDFNLIRSKCNNLVSEYQLEKESQAFSYLVIESIFHLVGDDIDDCITDTEYLRIKDKISGHDRGIDALFIDYESTPKEIHLFNFKYTELFRKSDGNFPSGEIEKLTSFITDLLSNPEELKLHVNPSLADKVEQISVLYDSGEFLKIHLHLCSNLQNGLIKDEKERLLSFLNRHSINLHEYNLGDFVKMLTKEKRNIINTKITLIDNNHFERSDGDIKALIANVDVRELLKSVIDNEDIRLSANIDDYEEITKHKITPDAFEYNVRLYLEQKTEINKNIKNTAKSEDNHRFFYYNNGITITCKSFTYTKARRSPVVDIKDLQIVNGGQTINSLFEAFKESPSSFGNVEVLCRIYETENDLLSLKISENTNSQNPVKSRDIRSNDYVQLILEKTLLNHGYFYERKKSLHRDKPLNVRIDAEKIGQVLLAIYNKMPSEAKDKKRIIFSEKYNEVFNPELTAEKVILAFELYKLVDSHIKELRAASSQSQDQNIKDSYSFVSNATFYILYTMVELSTAQGIEIELGNLSKIKAQHEDAIKRLATFSEQEKEKKGREYSHRGFFTSPRPKIYIEDSL